ncbi:hypothetical protein [Geodermatophilus sp. URMC 64]
MIPTRLVELTPHARDHGAPPPPEVASARHLGPARHEILDNLRRLAVHLETAALLDRRADRSPNPALAAVFRERAEHRRRIAAQLREHLAGNGLPTSLRPGD